jgi:hypothetical protein
MRQGLCVSLGLLALSAGPAWCAQANSPPAAAPNWEVLASCAAAYLANWRNRSSGRAADMSTMIRDTAELYKAAAIGHYESDRKAPKNEATLSVDGHVKANVERFITMDKAGTLEAYIEACPQPEEPN